MFNMFFCPISTRAVLLLNKPIAFDEQTHSFLVKKTIDFDEQNH